MIEIRGSSVLLLGYGREGKAVHHFLLSAMPELRIGVADRRPVELISEAPADTAIYTGEDYLQVPSNYDTLVRSPGLSPLILPRELVAGRQLTTLMNIFFSLARGRIVGITGTKGKSTTSSLVADLLSAVNEDVRLVGNIGKPALEYLNGADEKTIFVCELSSFQLEDLHYSPHVAVLLDIFPEHLDHHGTFAAYAAAKANIAAHQRREDVLIVNEQLLEKDLLPGCAAAQIRRFSPEASRRGEPAAFIEGGTIFVREEGGGPLPVIDAASLPLRGKANAANVLAAVAAAAAMGMQPEDMAQPLKEFKALEHRLEFVGEYRGVRFFNDSLSTIPQAAIHALEALGPDVDCLIAGGHDRGIDYSPIGRPILDHGVKTLILLPATGARIWQAVAAAAQSGEQLPEKFETASLEEAVRLACAKTAKGRICLLSPASSSLNMFRSYEERGNLFKEFVRRYGGQP